MKVNTRIWTERRTTYLDVVLDQTGAANSGIALGDDGGTNDPDATNDADTSAIEGSTIPFIEFTNPTDSLDVPLGDLGDTITMNSMDSGYSPSGGTTLTGGDLADTFNVTPDDDSRIAIDGNNPSSDPGDVLIVNVAGLTAPILTTTEVGSGTVTESSVGDVVFQEIEDVSAIGGSLISGLNYGDAPRLDHHHHPERVCHRFGRRSCIGANQR